MNNQPSSTFAGHAPKRFDSNRLGNRNRMRATLAKFIQQTTPLWIAFASFAKPVAAPAQFIIVKTNYLTTLVKYIGDGGDVTVPAVVQCIGDYAFAGTAVTNVHMQYNVEQIGRHAFEGCRLLRSVALGDKPWRIGSYAFASSGLENIVLNSVSIVEDHAFYMCSRLVTVCFYDDGVRSIGPEAFAYCRSLTSLTLPTTLTEIGERAFIGCSNLPYIIIRHKVGFIGQGAFADCERMWGIFFVGGVPRISGDLFGNNAPGLTVYRLPESQGWGRTFSGQPVVVGYYNQFIPLAGTYEGLFYETNQIRLESSGFCRLTVTKRGAVSARIRHQGKTFSASGTFAYAGDFSTRIPNTPLSLKLRLNVGFSEGEITGTISNSSWTAQLAARQAHFSRRLNPAPQEGKYTLVFPGADAPASAPSGHGFGTARVDSDGRVTVVGTLGDGTKLSQRTIISREGQWPLYADLYSGKGSILGWLTFTYDSSSDINGTVAWTKSAQPGRYYPVGFTANAEVSGSVFQYSRGIPLLNFTTGDVRLMNGNLPAPVTNAVTFTGETRLTAAAGGTLGISPSSGIFKGRLLNPSTGRQIAVTGVVLQKQNIGAGFFAGTNETGSVVITPR